MTTVAGIGNNGVFVDGVPATEAVLNLPSSVAVGSRSQQRKGFLSNGLRGFHCRLARVEPLFHTKNAI